MTSRPTWNFIARRPAHLIAFGFGAGLAPVAPGTVGTLLGFPLYFGLSALLPTGGVIVALLGLFLLGVHWCDIAGRAIGEVDHPGIVWDEIVAMAFILCFVPAEPLRWVTAFVVFRVFDILKPWPIRLVDEQVQNGFGVMLDDVVAAIFAIVTLAALAALFY